MYFVRKTMKKIGDKLETHIEEINKKGNIFHRAVRNYLGGRLTRKNVGKVSKKNIQKLLKTVQSELNKTLPNFPSIKLSKLDPFT
jgi:hypothetical protein